MQIWAKFCAVALLALGQNAIALPCSSTALRSITVAGPAEALALVETIACTGGNFAVEWIGDITVNQTLSISGGTTVTITGSGPQTSVLDGGRSVRLFEVSDAILHLEGLSVVHGKFSLEDEGNGGAIYAVYSEVTATNCDLSNNTAGEFGGSLFAMRSTVRLDKVVMASNTAAYGGAVCVWYSEVTAMDSTFYGNTAPRTGGGIFTFESTFVTDGCEIAANSVISGEVGISGGGVFVMNSMFHMLNTRVHHNIVEHMDGLLVSGGGLIAYASDVLVRGSNLKFNTAISDVTTASSFLTNADTVSWGGAMAVYFTNLIMDSTECEGNSANFGACIAAILNSNLSVSATLFDSNTAIGGAGIMGSDSGIEIESSLFVSNHADVMGAGIWSVGFEIDSETVGAEVIDVETPLREVIVYNSTFRNNTAATGGAGIAVNEGGGLEISGSDFLYNKSPGQGGGLVTAGVDRLVVTSTTFEGNEGVQNGGGAWNTASGGYREPATFSDCDFIDNISKTGSGGGLASVGSSDQILGCRFRGNIAGGDGGGLWMAGAGFTSLESTLFEDNEAAGSGPAVKNTGTTDGLVDVSFSGNNVRCDSRSFFVDVAKGDRFSVVCAGCTACPSCVLEEPTDIPVCTEAPEFSESINANDTVELLEIESGYWRPSNTSVAVSDCSNPDACVGGKGADYCAEGYVGQYCSICADGYGPGLSNTCLDCSSWQTGLSAAIFIFAALCLIVFLACVPDAHMKQRGGSHTTGCNRKRSNWWVSKFSKLRPVLAVWQISAEFAESADVSFPGPFQTLVQILAQVDFNLSYVYGCITTPSFYKTFGTTMIVPLVLLIVCALTSLAQVTAARGDTNTAVTPAGGQRKYAEYKIQFQERFFPLYLAVTFFFYSSVSSVAIKPFACEEIEGVSYLVADYNITCAGPSYTTLEALASLSLLVYVVGIPVSYVALLWHYRPLEQVDGEDPDPARSRVNRSLQQLWAPYRRDRWWFEAVECFRRAGIVAITVMTHDEGASQIALVLVATVISAYVTEIINPFAVGARPKPTVSTLNLFDKVKPGRVCGRGGSSVVDSLGGLNNIGSQLADIPGCNRGTSEDITATGILSLPGVSDCREREGGGMSDKADTNGDEVNSEGKDNEDDQPWVIAAHVGKNPDGGSSSDDAVTNGDEVKSEGKDNDEDEPWDITAHVGRNPGVAPFSSTGEIRDAVGNGGKNIDVASISDTDKVESRLPGSHTNKTIHTTDVEDEDNDDGRSSSRDGNDIEIDGEGDVLAYRLGQSFVFFTVLLALLLRVELAAAGDNNEVFDGLLQVIEIVAIVFAGAQFLWSLRSEIGDIIAHFVGKAVVSVGSDCCCCEKKRRAE